METKGFFDEWDEVPAGTTPATETPATEIPSDLTPGEADGIFDDTPETFPEAPASEGDVPPAFVEPDPTPAPTPGPGSVLDTQGIGILNTKLDTDVDLVFVIDATGSMGPFIDKVKNTATTFRETLAVHLDEKKRKVRNVRARVIAFRDYYCDYEPMRASRFFDLNDQADSQEFTNFVNSIEPLGGGDEPESALEALYEAMHSPWSTVPAPKRRQIIVLITDASAHSLEDLRRYDNNPENHAVPYPAQMAASLAELQGCWEDGQVINQSARRMALYTPNSAPWTEIGGIWRNTVGTPALTTLGGGDEVEMSLIFNFIANSI